MSIPKTYHLVTLGCPKNDVDSEHLERMLTGGRLEPVDEPSAADAIIVNTCGFIEQSQAESMETVHELAAGKREGQQLIVAGCMTQLYGNQVRQDVPLIDHVFGAGEWQQVAKLLSVDVDAVFDIPETAARVDGPSAYLKISDGCDAPCTFCVIPKIKGKLRSAPAGLLLRDAVRSVGRRRPAALALGGGGAALLLFVVSALLAAKGNSWGAQQTAVAAAVLLSLTFGAIGAPAGAMFTTTATIIGIARQLDDIGSVPRSQLLLVVVFAAIYAIAATTESASRAKEELEAANAQLAAVQAEASAAQTALDELRSQAEEVVPAAVAEPPAQEAAPDLRKLIRVLDRVVAPNEQEPPPAQAA